MGHYFLAADPDGWHRPIHRADMSFDCVHAAQTRRALTWESSLQGAQHADLVRQWMVGAEDAGEIIPRSDEWIPAEWLLRAWESPAMAAAEAPSPGWGTRLFEIEAQPVMLARSIPVIVPDLRLAGLDEFVVTGEVPWWWLLGPCGREVAAFLVQYLQAAAEGASATEPVAAGLGMVGLRQEALDVMDGTARVGAYVLIRAVIGNTQGAMGQFALGAALGFAVKDLWPDAHRLYLPWVQRFGRPDHAVIEEAGSVPYPADRL